MNGETSNISALILDQRLYFTFKTRYVTNPITTTRKIKKAQGEETTLSTQIDSFTVSSLAEFLKSFFETLSCSFKSVINKS